MAANCDIVKSEITEEEKIFLKRLPRRLPKRKNDVYVTKKTNFKAQLARSEALIYSNYNEIFVHGLGAAVSRAINLALQLKVRGHGSIEVACQTETVRLTDDLLYDNGSDDESADCPRPHTQTRLNSAVHIRVFRPEKPLPLEKGKTTPRE